MQVSIRYLNASSQMFRCTWARSLYSVLAHAYDLPFVRILWPIDADQPPNAIHLAEDLVVAYELLEVRNGAGLGTIYRTGKTPSGTIDAVKSELLDILARAFGSDGDAKRARLSELKSKLQGAWKEGGEARKDMVAFIDNV